MIKTIKFTIKKGEKNKENFIQKLKEHSFQLQKIGNVLNQINKNFYQGKSIKIEEVENTLEELWQSINLLKE